MTTLGDASEASRLIIEVERACSNSDGRQQLRKTSTRFLTFARQPCSNGQEEKRHCYKQKNTAHLNRRERFDCLRHVLETGLWKIDIGRFISGRSVHERTAVSAVQLTAAACQMTCKLTRQASDFATDWARATPCSSTASVRVWSSFMRTWLYASMLCTRTRWWWWHAALLAGDDTRSFPKRVGKYSVTFFNEYSWTTALSIVKITQGHLYLDFLILPILNEFCPVLDTEKRSNRQTSLTKLLPSLRFQ